MVVLLLKSCTSLNLSKFFAGKLKLTLPLDSENQAAALPLSLADPIQSSAPEVSCSSKMVSTGRACSCSPVSPSQVFSIEGFSWPDVRELRSKYCDHGRSQKGPVSRTRSIPESLFEGGLRRYSSCSSSALPNRADEEVTSFKPRSSSSREQRQQRLHRANSLDPCLSRAQTSELQKLQEQAAWGSCDSYYIAAEAPLPDDPEHKVIVMEKLPELTEMTKEAEEENEDGGYVQIRSPTSREKISIMAVIDRCRVYQESDDYKHREELKAKTELDIAAASHNEDKSQKTSSNCRQRPEIGHQSMVKNLREKFQNLS